MARIPVILLFLIILCSMVWFIVTSLRKGKSGLKMMLLGIHITLFGGIIAVDQNSNLGGVEYLIAFLGLIISILGLGKDD